MASRLMTCLFLALGLVAGCTVVEPAPIDGAPAGGDPQTENRLAALEAQVADLVSGTAPTGTVFAYAGGADTVPDGWMVCDGRELGRAEFQRLFDAIGTQHGAGDRVDTFNLPDYRGRFLRGVDQGTGRDPDAATRTAANPGGAEGDAVGSVQGDELRGHAHDASFAGDHAHSGETARAKPMTYSVVGDCPGAGVSRADTHVRGWTPGCQTDDYDDDLFALAKHRHDFVTSGAGEHTHDVSSAGGSESRPQNAGVLYLIKY